MLVYAGYLFLDEPGSFRKALTLIFPGQLVQDYNALLISYNDDGTGQGKSLTPMSYMGHVQKAEYIGGGSTDFRCVVRLKEDMTLWYVKSTL